MKKIALLFICLSMIFTGCSSSVSSSPDSDDSSDPGSGNTRPAETDAADTDGSSVIVKEILGKLPLSLEEFENNQRNTNNAHYLRNIRSLDESDMAGIQATGYHQEFGNQIAWLLVILKNDIKAALTDSQINTLFTLPQNFAISDATDTKLRAMGMGNSDITYANQICKGSKLKITYDEEAELFKVYWYFPDYNSPLLISGIYESNIISELFFITKVIPANGFLLQRYFKSGDEYVLFTRQVKNNGCVQTFIDVKNNNDLSSYCLGAEYNDSQAQSATPQQLQTAREGRSVAFKSGNIKASFTTHLNAFENKEYYRILDNNNFVIIDIEYRENNSAYELKIPLNFIETSKEISIDESNHFYVDYVESESANNQAVGYFEYREFEWCNANIPCYVLQSDSASTFNLEDGFTFTQADNVEQAINRINTMRGQFGTSYITDKISSDNTISELVNELDTWVNSLN